MGASVVRRSELTDERILSSCAELCPNAAATCDAALSTALRAFTSLGVVLQAEKLRNNASSALETPPVPVTEKTCSIGSRLAANCDELPSNETCRRTAASAYSSREL